MYRPILIGPNKDDLIQFRTPPFTTGRSGLQGKVTVLALFTIIERVLFSLLKSFQQNDLWC